MGQHSLCIGQEDADIRKDVIVESLEDVAATRARHEETLVDMTMGKTFCIDELTGEAEALDGFFERLRCGSIFHCAQW